jgi:hypothetical protein
MYGFQLKSLNQVWNEESGLWNAESMRSSALITVISVTVITATYQWRLKDY